MVCPITQGDLNYLYYVHHYRRRFEFWGGKNWKIQDSCIFPFMWSTGEEYEEGRA